MVVATYGVFHTATLPTMGRLQPSVRSLRRLGLRHEVNRLQSVRIPRAGWVDRLDPLAHQTWVDRSAKHIVSEIRSLLWVRREFPRATKPGRVGGGSNNP